MPALEDNAAFHQAIRALARLDPPPTEIVIACVGGNPGVARSATEMSMQVVELPRCGPAAARNAAARLATSDLLLFVDSDVAVHSNLIERVRSALGDESVCAVVGCYDDDPPEPNFVSQYKNLLQRYVHVVARAEGSTFWGACGAIRRDVFARLNGFDERFNRPSVEDIELGYRLRAAGFRIRFDSTLEVTHLKRWTPLTLLRSDIFRRALPWTWLLLRERGAAADLNVTYTSRLTALVAAVSAAALAAGFFNRRFLLAAAIALAAFALMERRLAIYFAGQRGWWFAIRALGWQWLYYLYSIASFTLGVATYPLVGKRPPWL